MKDLEEKLKALDLEFLHGVPVHLTNDMVEQIKQAFIDAGYVKPNPEQLEDLFKVIEKRFGRLMTGQEWYAYLEALAECNCESHINQVCDKCQIIQPFLNAAKKAAGLES